VVGLVQIAKLPDPAALVLLEAVTESKQVENPNGLVFISGQLTQEPAGATVSSLVARPAANLKAIAAGLNLEGSDFLRVTCFASSVNDALQVQALVGGTFPLASVSVMQIQKAPANSFVECDAVARQRTKTPARLVNPTSAVFAQAAVVTAPKVVFTSTFGSPSNDDAGVRSAFAKLKGAVEAGGSAMDRVVYAYAYPGDQAMLDRFRALRFEYLVRANAPASTNLVFEGAAGAKLGVDAIAVPK
jgi:enamine deaminase RidA (YjgF/YER057c/UK114 family)